MAVLEYPSTPIELIPNYITIVLSDFKGYEESFERTNDISRYPQQFLNTGNKLQFRYTWLCKDSLDIIRAFYKDVLTNPVDRGVFTLPDLIVSRFNDNLLKEVVRDNQYWVFDQNEINITPKIINLDYSVYDVNFTIKSVIA